MIYNIINNKETCTTKTNTISTLNTSASNTISAYSFDKEPIWLFTGEDAITDYLLYNYAYYRGCFDCGNYILDYLKYYPENNYYVDIMIKYFETYFEHTHSEAVAKILCDIFNGDYGFHTRDSIKFKYYDNFRR